MCIRDRLYFFLEGSQHKVLRVSTLFCVVCFLKKCFLKRNTTFFSYILISIFLILSLYFSFLNGFLFHSLLLAAISFFLYLIVINNLDFTFFVFLFVDVYKRQVLYGLKLFMIDFYIEEFLFEGFNLGFVQIESFDVIPIFTIFMLAFLVSLLSAFFKEMDTD